MGWVDNRPHQTDTNRLNVLRTQTLENTARVLHIERDNNLSLRIHPLPYFKGETPRDIGFRVRCGEVIGIGLAALAEHQDVRKALSCQKYSLAGLPLNHGVRRGGRPIDKEVGLAEQGGHVRLAKLLGHDGQALLHTVKEPLSGREALPDRHAPRGVSNDNIGKRAANVDGNAILCHAIHPCILYCLRSPFLRVNTKRFRLRWSFSIR